ncbi:dTDP-4-dehydrorhamnose 3,5-epimerase [Stutzerimonas frequens]|uniref:dTDP-4-dehydrorhamnose 3,5-epimerase n=1 Tax=Stutzerimonas frequens TaxID=2968969 RepID=UPI003F53B22F
MQAKRLQIPDVILIEPKVYSDQRGFFFESFNSRAFEDAVGRHVSFVQDNHSSSIKDVLRGLHYQITRPQGKLVRVTHGEVYDVAVDLRAESATFGHWVGEYLSAQNRKQLWIPEGFAHGFLVISDCAEFLYKATDYYDPTSERSILWNDPALAINWPVTKGLNISQKDQRAPLFMHAEHFKPADQAAGSDL